MSLFSFLLRTFFPLSQKYFFVYIVCFASFSFLYAESKFCQLDLQVPKGFRLASKNKNFIVLEKNYKKLRTQWLLSCNENLRRTSKITEFTKKLKNSNEAIHAIKMLKIQEGLEAILIERTRLYSGARLNFLESYFATRNYEYRLFVMSKNKNSLLSTDKSFKKKLYQDMEAILLKSSFSTKIKPAITEEKYQKRLSLFINLIVLFFILLALGLGFGIYSKKKKSYKKN